MMAGACPRLRPMRGSLRRSILSLEMYCCGARPHALQPPSPARSLRSGNYRDLSLVLVRALHLPAANKRVMLPFSLPGTPYCVLPLITWAQHS